MVASLPPRGDAAAASLAGVMPGLASGAFFGGAFFMEHQRMSHTRRGPPILPAVAVAWAGLFWAGATAGPAAEPAAEPAGPTAVEFDLRVRGELFAAAAADAEPARRPIALDARFEFTEQPASGAGSDTVLRRYATARAVIQADGQPTVQRLAADAREVLVRLQGTMPRSYLAEGFLSRDEAELLDLPFDPLLLSGLRPGRPVTEGEAWKLSGDLVAGLLAIDTVESGGIEARLTAVAAGGATIMLQGTVTGAVDGVPTRIEVTGRAEAAAGATDDGGKAWLIDGPVTAIEATVSERREAGWVAPGLDVEATIAITRSGQTAPPATAGEGGPEDPASLAAGLAPPAADRPAGAGRPGMVWQRHRHGRYATVLDARWRVVEDGPEGLVLRFSDRGRLVAQCSILPLPRVAADAAPVEATVCDDVRRSLGEQFGLLTESEASTREDGTRIVRVVAEGAADGRPFRWIHYVLTDPAGHRVAATFMHEPGLADRFAAADRELVAGLVALPDARARQAVTPAAGPR